MKKVIKFIIIIAVIALVAFLLFRGFGLGGGKGGEGESTPSGSQGADESGPDTGVIVVTIRESTVTLDGKDYTEPDAFKAAVEALNDDSHTFEIAEENAIEATYEWVLKVFEDLSITPKVPG